MLFRKKIFYALSFLVFIFLKSSIGVVYSQNIYECDSYCRNKLKNKSERNLPKKLYIQTKNFKNYRKKHRLRIVTGNYDSENLNILNNSLYFIYSGWGFGLNSFKYEMISSENNYSVYSTSLELSYTFGDKWTYTFSTNIVSDGEAKISNSDGEFLSNIVSSNSFSSIFGLDFTLFEILIGMRQENIIYKNFYNKSNKDALDSDFRIDGKQFILGIGKSF